MTKEWKIQDATYLDNLITKKIFDSKTESVYYNCDNLPNNDHGIYFASSGAYVLISDSSHSTFTSNILLLFICLLFMKLITKIVTMAQPIPYI